MHTTKDIDINLNIPTLNYSQHLDIQRHNNIRLQKHTSNTGFFLTGAFIISDKRIKSAGATIVFPVGTAALATFAFAVGGLFLASAAGLAP